MNWKTAGIIFLVILFLGIVGALTFQITRSTESQRAREIVNYTFEPHFGFLGGCARYNAMPTTETKKPSK